MNVWISNRCGDALKLFHIFLFIFVYIMNLAADASHCYEDVM